MDNIIFGSRTIIEAIKANKEVEQVFISETVKNDLNNELIALLKEHHIKYKYVPSNRFNKYKNKNHQGVYAKIALVKTVSLDDLISNTKISNNPIFIILDHVDDVRNFGAIARTAECTNVKGLIIPNKGSAAINGDAIKTSAGALFNLPVCKVSHIKDAIFYLQGEGYKIVAATEKTDDLIYDVNLNQPIAIVMGSEGKGISSSVLKLCDYKAKLPMLGSISSLNVSVACGALLYEAIRQRH